MNLTHYLTHVEYDCRKLPCRNAQHWKLFDSAGREIKDTTKRIDAMRRIWHGLGE